MTTSRSSPRRRSPGEGSVFEYETRTAYTNKKGERTTKRFGYKLTVKLPDGSKRQVLRRRGPDGEIWTTQKAARDALDEARAQARQGAWVDPSKQPLGEYLDTWVAGRRGLKESTAASYRKNIRLHIKPYIGSVRLASLTPARIEALYRELERGGRTDHKAGEGLSARTVRYVHTILRSALKDAVNAEQLLRNPADKAKPPSASEAKAPEMRAWNDEQLRAFLRWSRENSPLHSAWYVLAMTGLRRGELLALRWRDIDLDAGTISVRRSVGVVKVKGGGERLVEGSTKTKKARVVDIDPATVALLRAHKRDRGGLALPLARPDAVVFGDLAGSWLHPERFSRTFKACLARFRAELAGHGIEPPDEIRLHDLRHTMATCMLGAGVHVKVVSERLGHGTVSITLDTYTHVLPSIQREAVNVMASIMSGGA